MKVYKNTALIMIVFSIFAIGLLCGCGKSPLDPISEQNQLITQSVISEPCSHHLWGFSLISIDTLSNEIEILPVRSANLHLNLTGVLNNSMGVTAAPGPGSDPTNGLFVMDVTLTHPFGTKPQLAGFDVKGILITPGTLAIDSKIFADADETRLENADGYTRWWNPTEFTSPGFFGYTKGNLTKAPGTLLTATVNPYKYFADLLWPDQTMGPIHGEPMDNDMGRGIFRAGESNARRYMIRFPMNPKPVIIFGYAIDASWAMPSPNPPSEIPDNFPMNANMPEPYDIYIEPIVNTLYYDTESGVGGGVLRLRAHVYDWQGQDAGDIAGEVSDIRAFSPDMFSGGKQMNFFEEQPTKAKYSVDLTGQAIPTHAGRTVLAVKAVDSGELTYNQGVAPAPSETLASWSAISLDIPDPDCVGDANNDWTEAEVIVINEDITGQVCLPDDYRDYYSFTIPGGYALSGDIRLHCEAEPTTIGIYNDDEELILEKSIAGGDAAISMSEVTLWPGNYYLRIFTSNSTQVSPYYLEMNISTQDVTPTNPVEVTPGELYCAPDFMWKYEDWLIMFGTRGLWIYDATVVSDPLPLTSMPFWGSWTATFNFPMIYFIHHDNDTDYLSGVNISDMANPVIYENMIDFGEHVSDIAINSEYLFVVLEENSAEDMLIYDWTTDPSMPTLVDTGNMDPANGIELYDPEGPNTKLLGWSGFMISSYEVEDPHAVVYEGTAFTDHDIQDIAVQGSRIYCATRDIDGQQFVSLLMTDFGPQIKASLDITSHSDCIEVEDDYAFVGGNDEFTIIDISSPEAPEFEGSVSTYGYKTNCLAEGSDLYVVTYLGGFDIYDITYPPIPDPVYHFMGVNTPSEAVIDGNFIYVLDTDWNVYNALKKVDISDPANAHVADELMMTKALMGIAGGDGFIAVFDGLQDLILIDTTDLTIIETISLATTLVTCAVYEDTMYIACGSGKFYTYNVTDPSSPVFEDSTTLTETITDLAFSGDYMYALTVSDTVQTYSISNPYHPTLLDTYSVPGTYYEIEVIGDYLYMCTEETFEIADIGNPADPEFAGSVNMPGSSPYYRNMATDGYFAYFCGNKYSGPDPAICSGWPPTSPSVVYTFNDWQYMTCYDVQASDGYIYYLSTFGLRIFDLY